MFFPYSFWTSSNRLNEGLLAFWTFNNCSDLGHDDLTGHDLTIHGSLSCAGGKISNSLRNDSDISAYADFTDVEKKFNLTTDKTFAFWLKVDTALGGGGYFCGKWFNSPGDNYIIRYGSAGYVVFTIDIGGTEYETAESGQILSDDTWFFCVGKHTLSSKKISIQINNGAVIETTYTGTADDNDQNFRGLEEGSQGSNIDALGIWNRLLTSTEITYLYNVGNGREYPF
jgi:hypothetical protein